MSRLNPIPIDEMTPDQRRVYDIVTSTRKGGLGGPFSVWAHVPALAEPANLLHNAFRLDGTLDRRLFEMLILIVAHEYQARYVWFHHARQALSVGLEKEIIDAIEEGREPPLGKTDEQIVYRTIIELLRSKALSDSSFASARETLGISLLIELVSAVGFYSMVSLTVNAFEVPTSASAHASVP
jgi:4-carboxymuconolactone decarboxylase